MPAQTSVTMWSDNRLFAEAMAILLGRTEGIEFLVWPTDDSAGGRRPDVALVDTSGRRETALRRLAQLELSLPWARPIVLGVEREDESVLEYFEAGAMGYLLRGASISDLLAAIGRAMLGEVRCSPRVAASAVARLAALARHRPVRLPELGEPLTERERAVLVQIARGLPNKEIGRALRITVQTVKNHVHSVLAKLRVHRRREAVVLGHELGLLTDGFERETPEGSGNGH